MTRREKITWGLLVGVLIIVIILLWWKWRDIVLPGSGVQPGNVSFGGYNPGQFVINMIPGDINVDWAFEAPPALGVMPGYSAAGPCDCGCAETPVIEFMDLSDYAAELERSMQEAEIARISQFYYSVPPEMEFLLNNTRVAEFERHIW